MIIICPACTTHFSAPREAVGEEGRMVKCSRCGHNWFYDPRVDELTERSPPEAMPQPDSDEPEAYDPLAMLLEDEPGEDDTDNPLSYAPVYATEAAPKTAGFALKLGAVLSLLLAIISGLIAFHPHYPILSDVFDGIGLQATDGLVFTYMQVERNVLGEQVEVLISGQVRNESDEMRVMPDIVIALLSEGGREMGRLTYPVAKDILEPGETARITPEITNIPSQARHLILDIGNSWELSFR